MARLEKLGLEFGLNLGLEELSESNLGSLEKTGTVLLYPDEVRMDLKTSSCSSWLMITSFLMALVAFSLRIMLKKAVTTEILSDMEGAAEAKLYLFTILMIIKPVGS